MIEAKKLRAKHKASRGPVRDWYQENVDQVAATRGKGGLTIGGGFTRSDVKRAFHGS